MTTKRIDVANEIYKNYNYLENIDFIKNQVGNRKTVLDTSCRSGTFLNLLKEQGFEVTGLVSSRKMKKRIEAETECPLKKKTLLNMKKLGRFDVILSLFSACNKLKNYIQLDTALNKMTKCLSDDGVIIIDLIKKVKSTKAETCPYLNSSKVKIKKRKGEINVLNTYKLDNKTFKFKSHYKLFEIERVSNIAKKNGLKIVDIYRDYEVKIPDVYGDNVQIVLAKNTDETKKEKKKRKKQFVTKKGKIKVFHRNVYLSVMICMAVFGIFCGTVVGDYYNSNLANMADFACYSDEDVASAKGDPSKIDRSKLPDKLDPVSAFMASEYNMFSVDFSEIESGSLKPGSFSQQLIRGSITSKNGVRTRISASEGMMSTASKQVYENNIINVVMGSPTSLSQPEYTINYNEKTRQSLSEEEFHEKWGVTPSWFVPYVVCDKTVKSSSAWQNEGQLYTATLTMKTRTNTPGSAKTTCNLMAYTYYVKQMFEMSGVSVADFESCEITFTIDSNYKFQKIVVKEKYKVSYGFIVLCDANLTQDFSYEI